MNNRITKIWIKFTKNDRMETQHGKSSKESSIWTLLIIELFDQHQDIQEKDEERLGCLISGIRNE